MPRKIQNLMLAGPAGKLEAILEEPEDRQPVEAAIVCHPHPLYGGTMHNKAAHRIARGLRRAGAVTLRFNFRGVNRSEGSYSHGEGEASDARYALEWLRSRYAGLPATAAGFSFGARVALRVGCSMTGTARVIAAGFPTRAAMLGPFEGCALPKFFIQSTRDQYGPRVELDALFARLAEPKRLIYIEAADHFFAGALDRLEETVTGLGPAERAGYAPV